MQLVFTIANDTDGARLLDDICAATNYDAGSGKTKGQWVKEQLIASLRNVAARGEIKINAATSRAQIDAIVIT